MKIGTTSIETQIAQHALGDRVFTQRGADLLFLERRRVQARRQAARLEDR